MFFLKKKKKYFKNFGQEYHQSVFVYLFVWFDSLRPIYNLSVKQGRVFLGWSSTKLG